MRMARWKRIPSFTLAGFCVLSSTTFSKCAANARPLYLIINRQRLIFVHKTKCARIRNFSKTHCYLKHANFVCKDWSLYLISIIIMLCSIFFVVIYPLSIFFGEFSIKTSPSPTMLQRKEAQLFQCCVLGESTIASISANVKRIYLFCCNRKSVFAGTKLTFWNSFGAGNARLQGKNKLKVLIMKKQPDKSFHFASLYFNRVSAKVFSRNSTSIQISEIAITH